MIYLVELHGKIHDREDHVHSFISAPTGLDEDYVDTIIDKFSTAFDLISIKTSNKDRPLMPA